MKRACYYGLFFCCSFLGANLLCMDSASLKKYIKMLDKEKSKAKTGDQVKNEHLLQLKKEKKIKLWQTGTLEIKRISVNEEPVSKEELKYLDYKKQIKLYQFKKCGEIRFNGIYKEKDLWDDLASEKVYRIYVEIGSEYRFLKEINIDDLKDCDKNREKIYSLDGSDIMEGRLKTLGKINSKELSEVLHDKTILDRKVRNCLEHISVDQNFNIGVGATARSLFISAMQPFKVITILKQYNLDAPLKKPIPQSKNMTQEEFKECMLSFIEPYFFHDIFIDDNAEFVLAISKDDGILKFIPHWLFLGPQKNFDETKKIAYDIGLNYL